MHKILDRINTRFMLMQEAADDLSWKNPIELRKWMTMDGGEGKVGPGYHALRAIAGPCTDNPMWATDWTAPNGAVYRAGTPAPKWTEQEVHMAMAPQIRTWARGQSHHAFGGKHGARRNNAWIDDIAGNIHLSMQSALQQEKDQGRVLKGGGFVSWITAAAKKAGETGVGGTTADRNALGRVGDLLKCKDPRRARQIADMVKQPYTTQKSSKLDDDNPFGQFSPEIYALANALADAMEQGNPDAITAVREKLMELDNGKGEYSDGRIKDAMSLIQGTDTGRRTISTPHGAEEGGEAKKDLDKFMHTGISSVDTPIGDQGATLGSMIVGQRGIDMSGVDKEIIYKALELGRKARNEQPNIIKALTAHGQAPISDGDYRYLLRMLASWLPNGQYPGKGRPGEDPELDPTGQPSKWIKDGQPHMIEPDDIMKSIVDSWESTGAGITLIQIANLSKPPLTSVQADYIALLCGVKPTDSDLEYPGTPLAQVQIAKIRGVSKANVSGKLKGAAGKMGMTMDRVQAIVQQQAKAGGNAPAPAQVSADPLEPFKAWVQDVMGDIEESVNAWVRRVVVNECYRAICRLHYYVKIRPIMEGKVASLIPSRKVMGRM